MTHGMRGNNKRPRSADPADRAVLIGSAGDLQFVGRALRTVRWPGRIIGCIVTDLTQRPGLRTTVLGPVDQLAPIITDHAPDQAFVCLPEAMHELIGRVTGILRDRNVRICQIPTAQDMVNGAWTMPAGATDPSALIDRCPHHIDHTSIASTLADRTILITGAGGSIGSRIARRIAAFNPRLLILMERSENNLFEIDRLLDAEYPQVPRRLVLHDVADAVRTERWLAKHRPTVVYHTAAHKHVPMMEDHPRQALVNNFFGTLAIVNAAADNGVERFVMVSTDKAVNPTSVMGATKRAAELYVQAKAIETSMRSCIVRFGNVLGSACSVLPIWSRQLAEGGPITITDARMTRYFMTIPEAACLVIQASVFDSSGCPIYLLDMGQPIRIVDLAHRFIRAHGMEPGRDVRITFTGARPGEKLHEQLAYEHEDRLSTSHPSITQLWIAAPDPSGAAEMIEMFEHLRDCDDDAQIIAGLRRAVPQMESHRSVVATKISQPVLLPTA